MYPEDDTHYRDETISSVGDGYITMSDGWSLGFPEEFDPRQQPGDTVRLYGKGIGFPVRGLFLNHKRVYYRTEAEEEERQQKEIEESERKQRAEFEQHREEMDARYDALPLDFRLRIDKFRRNNPEFRWKYEEYELFVCEEAVRIAEELDSAEAVREFASLPYDKQRERVVLSDGHSGNTFGMACRLAWLYLTDPYSVVQLHGALAPLVGSKKYGCVPRDEDSP